MSFHSSFQDCHCRLLYIFCEKRTYTPECIYFSHTYRMKKGLSYANFENYVLLIQFNYHREDCLF